MGASGNLADVICSKPTTFLWNGPSHLPATADEVIE